MLVEDISSNEIKVQAKQKLQRENPMITKLGKNAINELELAVNIDNKQDVDQLSTILVQLLSYPDEDIAQLHAKAMRLGDWDLEKTNLNNRSDTSASLRDEANAQSICPCCGFKKQNQTIGVCTPFDEIKNMGVSTFLYFYNYKKLAVLLGLLTVIYSAYAIATNLLASFSSFNGVSIKNIDYLNISLSSKQLYDTEQNRSYYLIQCWIGVAAMAVWIVVLAYFKYKEINNINQYDRDSISCSDYSISLEGMPVDVTQKELQEQFDSFYQGISNMNRIPQQWKCKLQIAKINVGKPFYLNEQSFKDEEITDILKKLQEAKEKIINLALQRKSQNSFSTPKQQRTALYDLYRDLNKKKIQKIISISSKIKENLKQQNSDETTTVFVTFTTNIPRILMAYLHQPSLIGRIKSICGKSQDKFWYRKGENYYPLQINRAPEPEDIIWTNLGLKNCAIYSKKIFTFTITLVLLGICFAIVYGLSVAQQQAEKKNQNSRPISIAISLTISIVNVLLGQAIRRLTIYESDYTETHRQASLLIKSVLAQMVNTILIPVVSSYYLKNQNFYYVNGLVDNIFMLSISTSIVPPIMLLINPFNLYTKLARCIKSRPSSKLYRNQKEHNILYEGVEFQVGYQTIYSVSTFMFVCFFVSLQPIISVIVLIGYFLMYWVEKYSLFNRYKRPVPGMDFVNNAAFKMICLGPMVYSLGSMTWANFAPNGIPPESIIPNLVALGLGVLLFSLPFNYILISFCFNNTSEKPTVFEDQRIFMTSEFDRLNPATQAEGFEDYKKYIEKQLKGKSSEEKASFQKKFHQNQQKGQLVTQGRHVQIPGGFNPMMMMMPPQMMSGFGGPMAPPMPFMPGFVPMAGLGMPSYGMGMGFGQPYQPMNSFIAPQMIPAPVIQVPMAPMPPPMMPNPQNRPQQYGMSVPNSIPIPVVPPNNQIGSFNYGPNQQPQNYNPQRPMGGMGMVNNPNTSSQIPNPFNPNIAQNPLNPNYPPNNFNNQPYNMGNNNRNTRGW